jgi:hypothetical protein
LVIALISGALLVTALLGMFLYKSINKPGDSQAGGGLVSSAIAESQIPAESQETISGNLLASPFSGNVSVTPETVATSTLFSPALKPEDTDHAWC